ncbi:MAG: hypothetical protein CL763_05175 [Chloroflexi bacterium]|nr:hypothetical protein [Chloroflexota bacterium]|tara:strand:- start:8752 stop:9108 length:357 start_codon:yes stop_codon:yes gene_type:complete
MDSFIDNIPEFLISAYLIMGIFVSLALFVLVLVIGMTALRVIKSIARIVENIERTSDLAINRIIEPLQEGFSFKNIAGNATSLLANFFTGVVSNAGNKQRDKPEEEKTSSGRKKQKWG